MYHFSMTVYFQPNAGFRWKPLKKLPLKFVLAPTSIRAVSDMKNKWVLIYLTWRLPGSHPEALVAQILLFRMAGPWRMSQGRPVERMKEEKLWSDTLNNLLAHPLSWVGLVCRSQHVTSSRGTPTQWSFLKSNNLWGGQNLQIIVFVCMFAFACCLYVCVCMFVCRRIVYHRYLTNYDYVEQLNMANILTTSIQADQWHKMPFELGCHGFLPQTPNKTMEERVHGTTRKSPSTCGKYRKHM